MERYNKRCIYFDYTQACILKEIGLLEQELYTVEKLLNQSGEAAE